jgi:Rrf2 family protein
LLTKKGKYGLKAMVYLAGLEPDELAQVATIAEHNSISKKFLDHILSELRYAGLVYSMQGKGGGYALSRPAGEVKVGAIVRALVKRFQSSNHMGCTRRPVSVDGRPANN